MGRPPVTGMTGARLGSVVRRRRPPSRRRQSRHAPGLPMNRAKRKRVRPWGEPYRRGMAEHAGFPARWG